MPDALILHHYELSPFSEKIRRILAHKRLAWTSVRAPAVMPKPDLLALTGGYRKIPVLQIANHVYCDTALIVRVIEQRCPEPALVPTPIASAVAEWADSALFEASLPWIMRPTRLDDLMRFFTPDELARIGEDRREYRKDAVRSAPSTKTLRAQFAIYLARLEATLEHSPYLLGAAPCSADFSVYHPLWSIWRTGDALEAYPRVLGFLQRMAAIEDPPITPLSSTDALSLCQRSDPRWQPTAASVEIPGVAIDQPVVVRAADIGRDPVAGTLSWSALDEVVIKRQDPRAGTVYVHFPRLGYDIAAAAEA